MSYCIDHDCILMVLSLESVDLQINLYNKIVTFVLNPQQ